MARLLFKKAWKGRRPGEISEVDNRTWARQLKAVGIADDAPEIPTPPPLPDAPIDTGRPAEVVSPARPRTYRTRRLKAED